MKISNRYSYKYPNNNTQKTNFCGYIGAPIKEIHIQSFKHESFIPFVKELRSKCGKYFKIMVQTPYEIVTDFDKFELNEDRRIKDTIGFLWGQDNKIFLGNDKLGVCPRCLSTRGVPELAEKLGLQSKIIDVPLVGGNCFLGKKPNGEKFAIVGKRNLGQTSIDEIAQALEIEPTNIHMLSQPDFHIDLVIRPLNYPYVLVGDPKLMLEELAKKKHLNEKQLEYIKITNKQIKKQEEKNLYATPDMICQELDSCGFEPIKVPGLISDIRVNFMNALVHQKKDGSFIYVTNASPVKKWTGLDFEGIFKNYIKSHVPSIKKIYFIDGKGFIEECMVEGHGGVHCLSKERIDEEELDKLLQKNIKLP